MPEINFSSEKTVKPQGAAKPRRTNGQSNGQTVAPSTKAPVKTTGDALDINLMSEEFRGHPELIATQVQSRIMRGALLGLLVGGVVAGGAWGYAWFADQQLQDMKNSIASVNTQIAQAEVSRRHLSATQSELTNVKKLLTEHAYWSKFFEGLEKNTIPNVLYTSATTGLEGEVNLSAFARDYTSIGRQLVALREVPDFVASVTTNSANAVMDDKGKTIGVNFDMTIKVSPAFIKANTASPATP